MNCYWIFILIISTLIVLLTSGIFWGWSSLLIILENQHIYENLCLQNKNDNNTNSYYIMNNNSYITCPEQAKKLNLIFTIEIGHFSKTFTKLRNIVSISLILLPFCQERFFALAHFKKNC
jgi:hypothetical protein